MVASFAPHMTQAKVDAYTRDLGDLNAAVVSTRRVSAADDIALRIAPTRSARRALQGRRARFNAQVTYTATTPNGLRDTGALAVRIAP